MAIYNQGSFGYGTGSAISIAGGSGNYMKGFTKISFPQPMRIKRVAFKMGKFYGIDTRGNVLDEKGAFHGRYILWDINGNVIASTNVIRADHVVGGNQINRPDVWASFPNPPKVEANTQYFIGYSNEYRQYMSIVCYKVSNSSTWFNSNTGSYGESPINLGDVDYNVPYGGGWGKRINVVALFQLEAEPANTGVKLYANSFWNPRRGHRFNGSWWPENYLYIYSNGWRDVTS